jgi:5-oxoprolinase (ATP-hydrolysing)
MQDLLAIGNQSRPKILDLNIRRAPPLYSAVIEVDERVTLVGYTSDPKAAGHAVQFDDNGKVIKAYSGTAWTHEDENKGEIVQGLSGEAVLILRKPGEQYGSQCQLSFLFASVVLEKIRNDLQKLYDDGYRSLAVVFVHSYTYPEHELAVGELAKQIGFPQISLSSRLLPMIKMVPRGVSSTADAYLTPILGRYLDGFFKGFDEQLKGGKSGHVEFMGSDGGLLDLRNFSGLKSILSGPAGGVVGYALTSWDDKRRIPIIG